MAKKQSCWHGLTPALGAAVFCVVLSTPLKAEELTPEIYCDLAIQSMQLQLAKLTERTSTAREQQDQGPPVAEAYDQHVKAVESLDLNRLYARHGVTAEEYVTYMGAQGQAVEAYLAENPAVRQRIDGLASNIKSALSDLERARRP